MEIYVRNSPLADADEPALIVGLFADDEGVPEALIGLDERTGGLIGCECTMAINASPCSRMCFIAAICCLGSISKRVEGSGAIFLTA